MTGSIWPKTTSPGVSLSVRKGKSTHWGVAFGLCVAPVFALGAAVFGAACAHGRGAHGTPPIERASDRRAVIGSAPTELPDPCRGLALPEDQHFVAQGLCARVVASQQGELRQITFAPNGDLFGVTIAGAIFRYRDVNRDGVFEADEIVEWANTGSENGNNCDIDAQGGYLYAGTHDGVKRWKYSPEIDHGEAGEVVLVGQPGGGNHPFHPVHVYDGFMYVDSGSEHNATRPEPAVYDTERSVVKRFDLSKLSIDKPFQWRDGEVFASGLRNVTGFTRDAHGRIIGVVSGIDDVRRHGEDIHEDNPAEEIVALEQGKAYGFPFCFAAARVVEGGTVIAPGTMLSAAWASQNPLLATVESPKDDAWCGSHAEPPLSFLQAHSSPLGITFFDGPEGGLPNRYRGGAFIALHGSWDRSPSTGYKVIWVPFDAQGRAPMPISSAQGTTYPYEVVFGGGARGVAQDGEWAWSTGPFHESRVRPVGVAISPIDGALYVSSDNGTVPSKHRWGSGADGNLYRVGLLRSARAN